VLVEIAEWESIEARDAHMKDAAASGVYAPLAGMVAEPFRVAVLRPLA
jgi:quinol monooxygenase YgiN